MERLPVGLSKGSSGIEFFPESAKDAAPEITKALLHAFVNNLGLNDFTPPFAPWKLTTEAKDLAAAVGDEFHRLGVRPDELCNIGVSTNSLNKTMHDHFDGFFQQLKKLIRIEDSVSAFISTPSSIMFHNVVPSPRPRPEHDSPEEAGFDLALKYVTELERSRPLKAEHTSSTSKIPEQVYSVMRMVAENPASVVKAQADAGNPEAAFDYGVRYGRLLHLSLNFFLSHQSTDFSWAWAVNMIEP